jgi:hypothetical protein
LVVQIDRSFPCVGFDTLQDGVALAAIFHFVRLTHCRMKLTATQEIAPYQWVHPDEER